LFEQFRGGSASFWKVSFCPATCPRRRINIEGRAGFMLVLYSRVSNQLKEQVWVQEGTKQWVLSAFNATTVNICSLYLHVQFI